MSTVSEHLSNIRYMQMICMKQTDALLTLVSKDQLDAETILLNVKECSEHIETIQTELEDMAKCLQEMIT